MIWKITSMWMGSEGWGEDLIPRLEIRKTGFSLVDRRPITEWSWTSHWVFPSLGLFMFKIRMLDKALVEASFWFLASIMLVMHLHVSWRIAHNSSVYLDYFNNQCRLPSNTSAQSLQWYWGLAPTRKLLKIIINTLFLSFFVLEFTANSRLRFCALLIVEGSTQEES